MKQVFVGAPCGMWGGVKTNEKSRHRKFMKIETDSALQQNHSICKYQIRTTPKKKKKGTKGTKRSVVHCPLYLSPPCAKEVHLFFSIFVFRRFKS